MTSSHDSDINPYSAPSEVSGAPVSINEIPANQKPATPGWSWLFFAACLAIMIATGGGALWGALGGAMGGVCLKVSQNQRLPIAARLIGCVVITVALWGLILALVANLRGP